MKFGTLVRLQNLDECDVAFKKVKDLGLESCQLVFKPVVYDENSAKFIRKSADSFGIEISAMFAGFNDNFTRWDLKEDYKNAGINSPLFGRSRIDYLLSAISFVKALGITDMVIHAGFIANNLYSDEYGDMVCRVKVLADRAKELGVNILFETGGESPITLLRLIQDVGTGNLFVNLDTGNLIMYGYGNPCDAVYTLGKYIRNVHAKDGLPPIDPYVIGEETAIGKGAVDFKRFFNLLLVTGYDRFITIEREIVGEKQTKDIIDGLNYIKDILA